jgi:excisionase family DNA binding protein
MAIDTKGYITVTEAARRLDLSIEQVRRKLREGKLKGYRMGNQWFVNEDELGRSEGADTPLIPPETLARIDELRQQANEYREKRGKPPFDAAAMLRRSRDED